MTVYPRLNFSVHQARRAVLAVSTVLSMLATAIGSVSSSRSDPSAAVPFRRTAHIRLIGDWDCMRMVEDARAAFESARKDRAGAILLEMDGNRWRADIAGRLVEMVKEARTASPDHAAITVVAYLTDAKDQRVGGGQATLALCCDAVVVGGETRIESSLNDELRALYPPGTDSAAVAVELRKSIAGSGRSNGDVWSEALPVPTRALWWVADDPWSGAGVKLTSADPGTDPAFAFGTVAGPAGAGPERLSLAMNAAAAKRTGFAGALATSASMALSSQGLAATGVRRYEVTSGLASARQELHSKIADIDRDLRQIDADIREASRSRSTETWARRKSAGQRAVTKLEAVEKQIMAAEGLAKDYPELLNDVPPGHTEVGQKAALLSSVWRDAFQNWRDRLADGRARGEALANSTVP